MAEPKLSALVEEYIELRDLKSETTKKFKEMIQGRFDIRMDEIEGQLLNKFNELGVDNIGSKKGTAYRNTTTSVTIADQLAFRNFVIENEGWELLDWRANKTAVNDLVEMNEPVPPGINRNVIYTIGIRKKS